MNKKLQLLGICIFITLSFMASLVFSSELYVYPAKGQSNDQMGKDKYECHEWAKQQSGFDPMSAASGSGSSSQPASGGVVHGAARGALLGVAVGAIAGDAGKGAAIGAASGGLFGGMRQHDQNAQQSQAQQQQANNRAKAQDNYNRAYESCLSGRGYTVN